jgi:hypothetical protein
LYILAHKPFAISTYLYIQNRKPFVISESLGIPMEAYSAPYNRPLTRSQLVYTWLEVLSHQSKFVYTEPQAICYQRIADLRHKRGLHSFEPLKRISQPSRDKAGQTGRNPLKAARECSRYHRQQHGEKYLWHL